MELSLLTPPSDWTAYELLDCGGGQKLERFGPWVVARPEPQALWLPTWDQTSWSARSDATFRRSRGNDERGEWILKKGMPQQWWIEYDGFRLRLGLTAFKHVGVFPEQAANWAYITQAVERLRAGGRGRPQVLNLFAYTGGASLAARVAGAEVTHVDSVRQTVGWSRENMEASGLDGIRWVVEDALKFVRREAKRGHRYHGIVLDPPSYGRGPEGEKWVLEEQINELLTACAAILAPGGFVVLNLYSMGLSALLACTAMRQLFGPARTEQFGELYLSDRSKKALPLGVFYRGAF